MKLLGFAAVALVLAACSSPRPPAAAPPVQANTNTGGGGKAITLCPPDHQIDCEPDDDEVPPEERSNTDGKAKKGAATPKVVKPAHVERPTPTRRN